MGGGRPLYHTWRGMIRRCEDPKARGYQYYGGKGIKVCAEWHDYATFEAWIFANLGPRPEGMTLDRLDTWGPYAPGNVRWATHEQQRSNRMPPWWEWPEFAERRRRPQSLMVLAVAAAVFTALTLATLAPAAASAATSPIFLIKGQDLEPWCHDTSIPGGGQLAQCPSPPTSTQYQSVGLLAQAAKDGITLPAVRFRLCGTYGGVTYGQSDYTACASGDVLVFENYYNFAKAVSAGVFTQAGMTYAIGDWESWSYSGNENTASAATYYIGKAQRLAAAHGIHLIVTLGGRIGGCLSCMAAAAKDGVYMVGIQSQAKATVALWKSWVSQAAGTIRTARKQAGTATRIMAGLGTNTPVVHPVWMLRQELAAGQSLGISNYWENANNWAAQNQCTTAEGSYGCPEVGVKFLAAAG